MSESARATSSIPAESFAPRDRSRPRGGLVAQYRLDHRNPINHFLHVGVGWPMVAISILLLPFRPLWSAALFVSAYAIMFSRALRVRAERPDNPQRTQHAIRDRVRRDPRSLGRPGAAGKAPARPLI